MFKICPHMWKQQKLHISLLLFLNLLYRCISFVKNTVPWQSHLLNWGLGRTLQKGGDGEKLKDLRVDQAGRDPTSREHVQGKTRPESQLRTSPQNQRCQHRNCAALEVLKVVDLKTGQRLILEGHSRQSAGCLILNHLLKCHPQLSVYLNK